MFGVLHWAPSTLSSYDAQLKKYFNFMFVHGVSPSQPDQGLLADYFTMIAKSSSRPKSLLNMNSAALTCYFDALDTPSPVTQDVRKLIDGLIKGGTAEPMEKSHVMPREPFVRLFHSWPKNEDLPTDKLRLKTLTLLALTAMLCPSDLAPRAVCVGQSGVKNIQFSLDQVQFQSDGSVKLTMHGIKNDYNRDGFVVIVRPCSDIMLCPVDALKCYVNRNNVSNDPRRPVFTPLNYQYSGLSASSIGLILNKAIDLAGLDNKKYTAKCFRPTGATAAVQAGINPERVRQIGRWKNRECFEKHYVHAKPEGKTLDAIIFT